MINSTTAAIFDLAEMYLKFCVGNLTLEVKMLPFNDITYCQHVKMSNTILMSIEKSVLSSRANIQAIETHPGQCHHTQTFVY